MGSTGLCTMGEPGRCHSAPGVSVGCRHPGFGLTPAILGRPEWHMRTALARAAGLLYGLPCALDGNIHFCPFQRRGEVDRDDQLSWKLWTLRKRL